MNGWHVAFDKPWWLSLLVVIPLLWWLSFRSLAGLGKWRRFIALGLRTTVMAVFIFALAEIQLMWTSEKLAVIYVLDQSLSVPESQRAAMIEYVTKEVREHRNRQREDLAGVILFGRDAAIEVPPFDDDIHQLARLGSLFHVPRDATNLAAALKMAQASFPENVAKRVVVVTDGNENIGDARAVARGMTENGIGIDVVPVRLAGRADVAIEKVTLPPDVRQGQPFEARVVLNNFADPTDAGGAVKGKLLVTREVGRQPEIISEQAVELRPGKNVFAFQQKLDTPAVYTYKAKFVPATENDDQVAQNNDASSFTHVRGKGRVLLIEDWERAGDFQVLVDQLRSQNIEVDVRGSNNLFSGLAELQGYDSVVLANVPRVSGDRGEELHSFSDEQILMLVRNTEQLGCGLVMLGGENSFGVGGWANTELEKAMPVDFQIKNSKIQAVGALVLTMHASEMADGNYWQKVVGRKAIEVLGPMDYAGCIYWDDFGGRQNWMWNAAQGGVVKVGPHKQRMMGQIDRMMPGDMPAFDPGLRLALNGFQRVNASVKHMIIISDGDPAPPSASLLASFRSAGIKVSTVGIGAHGIAERTALENIATQTGGKFYEVKDPRALPAIFIREARKVARPLVKNLDNVPPSIVYRHEMLQGIDGPLPPLTGFVMTTAKTSPLVEVAIRSPDPPDPENSTILASWTYGLGRTVAFTTDGGKKWANSWEQWQNYGKFFSQMIRWSMRPLGDDGKFTMAIDHKDGKVKVVVTALDKDDEFLNFLSMSGAGLDPQLKGIDLKVQQVAPGRYVTEFDAVSPGSYFVTINPGQGAAPLLAGVTVPYSAEFRDRETNDGLLTTLAGFTPAGGEKGLVISDSLTSDSIAEALKVDT
ncbi:MAG TPA: VWA domain-containing protein, partial [Pirellulaceae bacterium]|nr:VWA domain-containing protein [Pirellulaceae bacterium]